TTASVSSLRAGCRFGLHAASANTNIKARETVILIFRHRLTLIGLILAYATNCDDGHGRHRRAESRGEAGPDAGRRRGCDTCARRGLELRGHPRAPGFVSRLAAEA